MRSFVALCALLVLNLTLGKQIRYNPNTDFLLHEGGMLPISPKKETTTLKPTSHSPQNNQQNSGIRDYVAPTSKGPTQQTHTTSSHATNTQLSSVTPQWPALKPVQAPTSQPMSNNNAQSSNGKRDYVAPQRTTAKPMQGNQQSTGKVHDLVNFYDNKGKENAPQGVPSYSSILQGNKNVQNPTPSIATTKVTQSITHTTPRPSTKPMSFSSIVAGTNKPNQPSSHSAVTTPKPTTRIPSSPTTPNRLPSSIVNSNRNDQANSGRPTDAELQLLSEELFRKDVNNAAKYVTINFQEKTTSQSKEDKAPLQLFTVSPEVWNIPTIQKFVPLLDNYERDTLVNEYITPQERNEENAFMDAIMSTTVIRHLMNFLKEKGYVTPDPRQQRDFLKQLWFNMFSRGKGKIGSSGFEHVFVSELKNGEVSGLHNWIYFAKEELANRINYLGYMKYELLNDKGAVLKLHFNQQGSDKPVDTMFIGTSPELEMALYTVCFVTRADNECKLKLANKDIDIVTHTFRYRSKNMIGSAYPQIPVAWR